MTSYLVRWEISLDADSFEDAALRARSIQRDRDSVATIFDVIDEDTREGVTIDLLKGIVP